MARVCAAFVLEAKARDDPLTVRKKVQIPNWSRIVRAWRDVLWSKFSNPWVAVSGIEVAWT